ncbi:hypothetical protein BKA63DRAFT_591192 [Paraphoma chrysanthemicola]|nr:hypothetical protein BKA63DRAFT_591192 [Paraphoma chrysanthemicola]
MKVLAATTLVSSLLLPAIVLAQGNSNGTYPTTFRATGFNSEENSLELGTTPVVPFGEIVANDPWSTPLVDGCPKLCTVVGPDPSNWTHVHDQQLISKCEEPLLLSINVQNEPSRFNTYPYKRQDNGLPSNSSTTQPIGSTGDACGAYKSRIKAVLSCGPPGVIAAGSNATAAVDALSIYLKDSAKCGTNIIFAKYGAAVVGVYAGADLPYTSASEMLAKSRTEVLQLCNARSQDAATLGIFATESFDVNFDKVHDALQTWASGECYEIASQVEEDTEWTILTAEPETSGFNQTRRAVASAMKGITSLISNEKRATCTAIQVNSGDGCASLAARCGIRGADFTKYNPKANMCSTLMPKQWVCCSAGDLPDMRPKPQADGTCAVYKVVENDGCAAIASNFGLTVDDIDKLNKKTWGWSGCPRLQPDQILCVSEGNTPMPAQIDGVACGPQKVGTQKPSGQYDGFALAKLNQCPLKACCSGWGFCGTTTEFCTESKSETGAPGSFKKGDNGCISNCGTDIVGNDNAPSSFSKVGYFQAYNGARDCLNMDVSEVNESEKDLTHVHFAFLGVTADFDVNIIDSVKSQWEKFSSGKFPFKKIISFGGWAESTEPGTFQRYKDAVKPENRNKFANNVVNFMKKHDLQGVDFDWEYPGASDIPGVPNGGEQEAQHYLRFLTVIRGLLDKDKSLSIALPASFWYLKPFPVDKISEVVDYFIYMTYDLHGQWDYGNKFANPGCDSGNCLRSHVNATETYNALSMITKAGVPASKIFVGVSSYGRSFRMADKSCTGEMCKFTGSFGHSDAEPGQCTGTGGYIANAELDEIFAYAEAKTDGFEAKRWYDSKTDSDIMTYGTQGNGMTDWVAYMSATTKSRRLSYYKDLNFGGTTDWAVDLGAWFNGPSDGENGDGSGWDVSSGDNLQCDSSSWPTNLEDLEKNINNIPGHCRGQALVRVLVSALDGAIQSYNSVVKDYDDKFGWYADWVKDSIDAQLDEFMALLRGPGLAFMDCEWRSNSNQGSGPCTEANPTWAPGPNPGPRIVTFKMRDEAGFYKALLEKTGIQKEWITFKDHAINDPCVCPQPNLPQCASCGNNYYMRKNFPRRINDKSKIQVDNPKKIIDEAIPNMAELTGIGIATYFEMRMGGLDADDADIGTALSMPLFMLQDASESIKNIKEIGEEQKETKTRNLVIMILSIVFAVIPFAGAAASALGGAARIAQTALIVGEAGNVALTIVEVVNDPLSAPFAILGLLLGAGGIRAKGPRTAFKDAADARRALDANDGLKLFSSEFKRKDTLVQNIIKACVR